MQLSIIIVNYNVKYYLEQCLRSIEKARDGIDAEIIVVDNHSRDSSLEYLKARFKNVIYIESNHNLGFAGANNIALRQAKGKYVLLLNPDTILGENTLVNTVAFMKSHSDAGALGVKMLHSDGKYAKESMRGIPTPATSLYKMIGLCTRYPHHAKFGHYYMGNPDNGKPQKIEIVSGAFCMLRHDALNKIGLLDEAFFMYGEDIDLSFRLYKAGYQNYYLPSAIVHYKGESTNHSSFHYVHVFYEAMSIFFAKHYGNMSVLITLPINIAILVRAFGASVGMLTNRLRRSLGFYDRDIVRDEYVFIGNKKNLEKMKNLALEKGLTGRFIEGDEKTLPEGHRNQMCDINNSCCTYIVYDVTSYSYEKMFSIFSVATDPYIKLGTYDPQTEIIITDKDIFIHD